VYMAMGLDVPRGHVKDGDSCILVNYTITRILQYDDVENFVKLCISNSRSIQGMKQQALKKSLNLQLAYGNG